MVEFLQRYQASELKILGSVDLNIDIKMRRLDFLTPRVLGVGEAIENNEKVKEMHKETAGLRRYEV